MTKHANLEVVCHWLVSVAAWMLGMSMGGHHQPTVANYPPDSEQVAYKLARGEMSIWDGISTEDRAAYDRVKRKLDERTDREAENFRDAKYKVRE